MSELTRRLFGLLKSDQELVDDGGDLILAAVQDHAWRIDHKLIKLLIADDEIKSMFFTEIEGHWIFEINKFLEFTSTQSYFGGSYTRFRNRIGLTIGDRFLRERKETVLSWPFKDAVLEGGQTKETESREEIFFNEVLAHDEINRLLDPKVLTNFSRVSTSGERPITGFKRDDKGVIRDNLIINGNNLVALSSLKNQFAGKVKLVYIDPPYNTGNDTFGYNDAFNRSTWLTFMKNRLEIASMLLSKDGAIFVQCDDSQYPYLKVLMDELPDLHYEMSYYVQVRYAEKTLAENSDYQKLIEQVLCYAKKDFKPNRPTVNYDTSKFCWKITEINPGKPVNIGGKEVQVFGPDDYTITRVAPGTEGLKEVWATGTLLRTTAKFFGEHLMPRKEVDGLGTLYKVKGLGDDGLGFRYFTGPKRATASKGKYYSGIPIYQQEAVSSGTAVKSLVINNFYDMSDAFGNCRHEGGVELRSGKKPEVWIKILMELGSTPGDLIVDFFLGTGTTAAVAHKMTRQYIGVEQLNYGKNDSVTRLKNVIAGDNTGISKEVNWTGGGDFIYLEVMKYNEAFIEKIQSAENSDSLLAIWREISKGAFLNWYINPKIPDDAIRDFEEIGKGGDGLEKQKHCLVELLDKNQLYVNLTEINDQQFEVTEEDKALNKAFYGGEIG